METETQTPEIKPSTLLQHVLVMDLHCQPPTAGADGKPIGGVRLHDMIVAGQRRQFRFEFGKGTEMPLAIATRFVKQKGSFTLVDGEGNYIEYAGTPKQPDEVEAGEKFVLRDDQTVARWSELSIDALRLRVAEMDGGEMVLNQDPESIRKWIINKRIETRKKNSEIDLEARALTDEEKKFLGAGSAEEAMAGAAPYTDGNAGTEAGIEMF